MDVKHIFIKVVNNIRSLNQFLDGVGNALDVVLEKPYQYTCDILNAFEDASKVVWDDNIWDDILNSDKDPGEIWDEVSKLIEK